MRVLVFAKAPQPGRVKTRLIPLLGAQHAAALHALLVERTLATAGAAAGKDIELWCAPSVSEPWLQRCAERHGVRAMNQCEGDIGARMLHAAERTLADASGVIIVGTDCPALTRGDFEQARTLLSAGHDIVLKPAEDGGYVLIGLARCDARLFDGIEWGSARVLAVTRSRLAALGWRWHELPITWDVDRPDDYLRLCASGLVPGMEEAMDGVLNL